MISVLVADDEPLAQEELVKLISENREFRVEARASSGREAFEKLESGGIRVAFLDIEMPGLTGLEVASRLCEFPDPPLVVFATAYEQYAVKAFEANAIDYVLKPYDPRRLQKTLARILELEQGKKTDSREKLISLENYLIRQGTLKKLVGHRRKSKDRIVIDPAQVLFFYADLAEVRAHLEREELLVNSTLKELLASLDPAHFAQSHKSYVINLDKIEKVSPMFSGNFQITLNDAQKTQIPLSRRFASHIKSLLGSW